MYRTSSKLGFYSWFMIGLILIFCAWGLVIYYKPVITESGCSEMAAQSSSIYYKNKLDLYPDLNYDTLKAKCLEESTKIGRELSKK